MKDLIRDACLLTLELSIPIFLVIQTIAVWAHFGYRAGLAVAASYFVVGSVSWAIAWDEYRKRKGKR